LTPAELDRLGPDLSAYVDGELDAARRGEIERLMATEPAVRARVAELRAVAQGLAGLPRVAAPAALRGELRRALDAAAPPDAPRVLRRAPWWWNPLPWSAAAAIALAVLVGWYVVRPTGMARGPEAAQAPASPDGVSVGAPLARGGKSDATDDALVSSPAVTLTEPAADGPHDLVAARPTRAADDMSPDEAPATAVARLDQGASDADGEGVILGGGRADAAAADALRGESALAAVMGEAAGLAEESTESTAAAPFARAPALVRINVLRLKDTAGSSLAATLPGSGGRGGAASLFGEEAANERVTEYRVAAADVPAVLAGLERGPGMGMGGMGAPGAGGGQLRVYFNTGASADADRGGDAHTEMLRPQPGGGPAMRGGPPDSGGDRGAPGPAGEMARRAAPPGMAAGREFAPRVAAPADVPVVPPLIGWGFGDEAQRILPSGEHWLVDVAWPPWLRVMLLPPDAEVLIRVYRAATADEEPRP